MIKQISRNDAPELVEKAKKNGSKFVKTLFLFGAFDYEGNVLGIYGLLFLGSKRARMACDFTDEAHRRKGHLADAINFRLHIRRLNSIQVCEAVCTAMSLNAHIQAGGKPIKVFKSGNTLIYHHL